MKLFPNNDLNSFIESYTFYENKHITNDKYLKIFPNGKVEMYIHYNESSILLTNGSKEIKLNHFISGIFDLNKPIKIKPISERNYIGAVIITFSFQGVNQLFGFPVKSFTNKVVYLESIFGKASVILAENIYKANSNEEREIILNEFFLTLIKKKKTTINIYNPCTNSYSIKMVIVPLMTWQFI